MTSDTCDGSSLMDSVLYSVVGFISVVLVIWISASVSAFSHIQKMHNGEVRSTYVDRANIGSRITELENLAEMTTTVCGDLKYLFDKQTVLIQSLNLDVHDRLVRLEARDGHKTPVLVPDSQCPPAPHSPVDVPQPDIRVRMGGVRRCLFPQEPVSISSPVMMHCPDVSCVEVVSDSEDEFEQQELR